MAKPAYSGPWRKIRLKVLERDGALCQIRLPGCKGAATLVDHIIPVEQGGDWWDESNLRAACYPCNNNRADHTGDRWRQGSTHIVLVIGPPSSGKTTYVEDHRAAGDLVVDYDVIAEALGSTSEHDSQLHAVTMAARNGVLRALRRGEAGVARAFIVSANPKAESVLPHHEVILIDPGIEEVRSRAERSGRPERWLQLIEDWYAERSAVSYPGPSRDW